MDTWSRGSDDTVHLMIRDDDYREGRFDRMFLTW